MIYDLSKLGADNEAILDFRDASKVKLKNDSVQAFYTKSDEVLSAVIDRPTGKILGSLSNMQVGKSEELKYLLHVHAQETTFGDMNYDSCRLKLVAHRHPEQRIKDSHIKARHRDEDRRARGAPNIAKAKAKGKSNAKQQLRERITKCQRSFGEACAFKHDPNKKDTGKGRPLSPSPTGSSDGKVVITEVRKAHQNLLVKVCQGKRTDYLVQASRMEVARGKFL